MRILVTAARMPFAVNVMRKLSRRGHEVFAADSLRAAPGLHSSHASRGFVTHPPADDPAGYAAEVAALARDHAVDLIVPGFEDVLPLSVSGRFEAGRPRLFGGPGESLLLAHHKGRFLRWARERGLPVAELVIAPDRAAFERAAERFGHLVARRAFSRVGASTVVRAPGEPLGLDRLRFEPGNPWVVQPHVEGEEVSTFVVAREGRVRAHVTYRHPIRAREGGGIYLVAVDEPELERICAEIVEALGLSGHFGFDFLRGRAGTSLVECNVRLTAGVSLLGDAAYERALLGAADGTVHPTPEAAAMMVGGLLRAMGSRPRAIPKLVSALLSGAKPVDWSVRDPRTALYEVRAYFATKRGSARDDAGAYVHDLVYDGPPPG